MMLDTCDSWDSYLETPPCFPYSRPVSPEPYNGLDQYYMIDESMLENLKPSEMPEPLKTLPYGYYMMDNYCCSCQNSFLNGFHEIENRTIRLSNVPPDSKKEDLKQAFAFVGDVEKIDFSLLEKGVVCVTYYDIRDANKLRMAKLYINSRPITSAYEMIEEIKNCKKPPNNGTIVLFHLPRGVTDDELRDIFEKYGEIRDIRSTQGKETQKFIEYYDTRAAQAALSAQSGKPIHKSRVAIEYSLPGGYKKMQSFLSHKVLPTIERVHRHVCAQA